MALMICSPRGVAQAHALGEKAHYNSFLHLLAHAKQHETPYTPNVLNLYFLNRMLQKRQTLACIAQTTQERYENWLSFFDTLPYLKPCDVDEDILRSRTVFALQSSERVIRGLHHHLSQRGFQVSQGYGALRETNLRIANFPAIRSDEIAKLQEALRAYGQL